jgi:hypothetical protein
MYKRIFWIPYGTTHSQSLSARKPIGFPLRE